MIVRTLMYACQYLFVGSVRNAMATLAGMMAKTVRSARERRLRFVLRVIVVGLAIYPAWINRFGLINDTVSYLDMGDQFFSGQLDKVAIAINDWLDSRHPGTAENPGQH